MGEYRMAWASSNRKQANWKGVRPVWGGYDEMWGKKIKLINIMKHLINYCELNVSLQVISKV